MKRGNNIVLIGFMGCGKTSVGQMLACKYGYEFIDTDVLVEARAGMTVSEIFRLYGEERFRSLETTVLSELIGTLENGVLSTGGGLPLRQENATLLSQVGEVVFLKVKKETILKRLEGDTTRPLLQGEGAADKVESLLKIRNPIYDKTANHVVEVDEYKIEEVVEQVKKIHKNS